MLSRTLQVLSDDPDLQFLEQHVDTLVSKLLNLTKFESSMVSERLISQHTRRLCRRWFYILLLLFGSGGSNRVVEMSEPAVSTESTSNRASHGYGDQRSHCRPRRQETASQEGGCPHSQHLVMFRYYSPAAGYRDWLATAVPLSIICFRCFVKDGTD